MCEVSPETQHPCYSSFKHQYPSKQQCSVSTVFAVHSSMTSHKSQCTDIALNSALNSAQFPSLDVPSTAQKMCQAPLISTLISKHARKYYTYISGKDCVLYQNARASYISIVGQAILNCLSHYGNIWVYFREATTAKEGEEMKSLDGPMRKLQVFGRMAQLQRYVSLECRELQSSTQ